MTGRKEQEIKLGYKVHQVLQLPHPDENFLRGIILLDSEEQAHVFPENCVESALAVAGVSYLYTADTSTGLLTGYSLAYSTPQRLIATRVWEVKLPSSEQLLAVASKSQSERVHSQGRVLADRSVMYKYLNPNLVAVVTHSTDPVHKHLLNVYLVDAVSGAMVFSATHKRAKGPIHIVHSENWVLYSFYNEKSRRTEIATLELYEGKAQSNSTAFSSMSSLIQPIVERQAFIMPAVVESMRETITEKGITSKHILLALSSGGILQLPWMFVDPRRPVIASAEMRDEGVIPYVPELPVPPDAIINYNQSVHRIRGIHTAPSGLESTCLVLAYGLAWLIN
ncbi:hypothetical protein B566_EDAN003767 [Ephemera danica]|nr:hypothetical protein B566_EDAN003767 [Ephemera danica]